MENVALYDTIILLLNVTAISTGHGNEMFAVAYETQHTVWEMDISYSII